jgi:hypothetical protein
MRGHVGTTILVIAMGVVAAACGPTVPSPAVASNYSEYVAASCSAWETLFRVVGNPDTAAWTDEVHQLQAAAETRDAETAAGLQGQINTELEAARQNIAYAGGWPPATRTMAALDRFFGAMEVWTTAYVDIAKGVPNAPDPQAAFEAAGGLTAWRAMLETFADINPYRSGSDGRCPGAPISP